VKIRIIRVPFGETQFVSTIIVKNKKNMAVIRFTSALKRFYPNLEPVDIQGNTIAVLLSGLEKKYPTLTDYLIDEHGTMRQHIHIYIGDRMVIDRIALSDTVSDKDEIWVMQALSGG
jgi:sulfur-carrier protein